MVEIVDRGENDGTGPARDDGPLPLRKNTAVRLTDPDFAVHVLSFADLLQVQREDEANGWATRWTSERALRAQVRAGTQSYLLPAFRHTAPAGGPEVYKCWLWYASAAREGTRSITLLHVSKRTLDSIPVASSVDDLKRAVYVILGSAVNGTQFESLT